jgi:hypothetical protein
MHRVQSLNSLSFGLSMDSHLPLINPEVSIVLPVRDTPSSQYITTNDQLQQSPVVSRFEIEESMSPARQSAPTNDSFAKKIVANESTILSGRSTITRVTSEGRILGLNQFSASPEPKILQNQTEQQLTTVSSAGTLPNISAVLPTTIKTSTIVVDAPAQQIRAHSRVTSKFTQVVRKYCKKNCGDVCNCMAEMLTVVTRADR